MAQQQPPEIVTPYPEDIGHLRDSLDSSPTSATSMHPPTPFALGSTAGAGAGAGAGASGVGGDSLAKQIEARTISEESPQPQPSVSPPSELGGEQRIQKHAVMMQHMLESATLESLETFAAMQLQQGKGKAKKKDTDEDGATEAFQLPGTTLITTQEDIAAWTTPVSKKVKLLIIARQKKVTAKPMLKILEQFALFGEFDIGFLSETMLFNTPENEWPTCQCLIAFHSSGYPLEKVDRYVQLHHPFMVNDVSMQKSLLDRRDVFRVLLENNIPVPPHLVVSRDKVPHPELIEKDDSITFGEHSIHKPFVEKPVNADNHEIYVFFSAADGGGAQYLFRKAQDRSSEFYPDCNNVHRDGSFIYEEFVPTGGTDIKVYTVGTTYAHAEGRKSPVVDGKVLRDPSGKEVRCPIMLNAFEKEIAAKVVKAFKQNVCGFDLLRTQGKSYVCDVNGWSFVKRAPKYYEDCACLLRTMLLKAVAPQLLVVKNVAPRPLPALQYLPPRSKRFGELELRCVIAVIRHGDRTPKQKMKMTLNKGNELLSLFTKFATDVKDELKLKTKPQLEYVLALARSILSRARNSSQSEPYTPYSPSNPFSPTNAFPLTYPIQSSTAVSTASSTPLDSVASPTDLISPPIHPMPDEEELDRVFQIEQVLSRSPISGINRKVQLKPLEWEEVNGVVTVIKAQLVLKWGGELTEEWFNVSQQAGHFFRENMYPSSQEAGLLRLHSTYRHDLKMYSSDEGRVQMTAAAFAKGLLDLEGDLPPILVSLVRKDKAANELLDDTTAARRKMDAVKLRLHALLSTDAPCSEIEDQLDPLVTPTLRRSMEIIGNPRVALRRLYSQLCNLVEIIRSQLSVAPVALAEGESPRMFLHRWEKMEKDFYNKKKDQFDVSKIPDIYDQLKYDVYHGNFSHLAIPDIEDMFKTGQALADITVVQEYGVTRAEKLEIGAKIAKPLVEKLVHDLRIAAGKISKHEVFQNEVVHHHRVGMGYDLIGDVKSPNRHVRTRLYFTSESHVHSLYNLLLHGEYAAIAHSVAVRRGSTFNSIPVAYSSVPSSCVSTPISALDSFVSVPSGPATFVSAFSSATPSATMPSGTSSLNNANSSNASAPTPTMSGFAPQSTETPSSSSHSQYAADRQLETPSPIQIGEDTALMMSPVQIASTSSGDGVGASVSAVASVSVGVAGSGAGAGVGAGAGAGASGATSEPYAANSRENPVLFGNVFELNYLSHIVCRLFERPEAPFDSDEKYIVEWLFTPGMTNCTPSQPYTPSVAPFVRLHTPMSLSKVERFFENVIGVQTSGSQSPAN